ILENVRMNLYNDYLPRELRFPGYCGDRRENGTSSSPLPASSPSKMWQGNATDDLRHYMVWSVAKTMLPSSNTWEEERAIGIVQYAKKVELDFFDNAKDREEYFNLVAAKIVWIQKAMEGMSRKRLSKASCGNTIPEPRLISMPALSGVAPTVSQGLTPAQHETLREQINCALAMQQLQQTPVQLVQQAHDLQMQKIAVQNQQMEQIRFDQEQKAMLERKMREAQVQQEQQMHESQMQNSENDRLELIQMKREHAATDERKMQQELSDKTPEFMMWKMVDGQMQIVPAGPEQFQKLPEQLKNIVRSVQQPQPSQQQLQQARQMRELQMQNSEVHNHQMEPIRMEIEQKALHEREMQQGRALYQAIERQLQQ
ncbi:hypothetical protein PFISCL1PPCAC_9576, partial [Pristionchus fissidentatus]